MIGKIWAYLNGKKLVIGSIIALVAQVVETAPVLLPLFVNDAAVVAKYVGLLVAGLGFLHKVYKLVYREEYRYENYVKKVEEAEEAKVKLVESIEKKQEAEAEKKE